MFLHAIGSGIVTAAVMALAAVGFTVQFGVHISVGATVRVLGMVFTATQLTLVAIAAVALAALHGTRLGKVMRAAASDPATWRGRFRVHWADWLDPRIVYDAQSSPWAMKLP